MPRGLRIFFILLATGSLGWIVGGHRIEQWRADRAKRDLPSAEQLVTTTATTNAVATISGNVNTMVAPAVNAATNRSENLNAAIDESETPAEKNLAVPFTSQAPHANWDTDHGEFCEEAAVLMVGRYFQRRGISSADDAEEALQRIKQWELENIGWYFDTTATETASILTGMYELQVTELENPTIKQMRDAIGQGQLVVVPAAGRELGNPNFTAPGPIYHNLVIRGYTKSGKFITNDPGTRKGQAYVYDQTVVMKAIHDWVPGQDRTKPRNGGVVGGRKVVLVVSQ